MWLKKCLYTRLLDVLICWSIFENPETRTNAVQIDRIDAVFFSTCQGISILFI